MMEVGRELEVLNPYDWLPSYGETTVNFITQDSQLSIMIDYDGENNNRRKEIKFSGVCSFYVASMPGPIFLDFDYNASTTAISSLVEYPDSDAAAAWARHYDYPRVIKHYRVGFIAANMILIVFANGFALIDH